LGKERIRMMNFSRWWKGGEWDGSLGYFERIEVSRIVLGAKNFRGISQTLSGLVAQLFIGLGVELKFDKKMCFVVSFLMS
jgi:hypothetical protein